jgi:hypothetical protein
MELMIEKAHVSQQKLFINRALLELKRRPDKLYQVKQNILEELVHNSNLSAPAHRHLAQLNWVIASGDVNLISNWLNHKERNPVGYPNWALAFKDLL